MDVAKEKAIQIFNFLKALYELKFPVIPDIRKYDWKLFLEDIPDHNTVCYGQPFNNKETTNNEDFIIKVRRPQINSCPVPPDEIADWIEGSYNEPEEQISHKLTKTNSQTTEEESFYEVPERIQLYEKWVQERDNWAKTEIIIRQALRAYDKLYSLYTIMNREGDRIELILGDGFLYCPVNGYEHPVLLLRVQLDFDPSIPEFTILMTEKPTELYSRFIRNIPEIDITKISQYVEQVEDEGIYPFEGDRVKQFLIEMVQAFSRDGLYIEDENEKKQFNRLIAFRKPVLFIRKRESDYIAAINNIVDDIKETGKLPHSISGITGIETKKEMNPFPEDDSIESKLFRVNGISEDILFSKPANEEQLMIAQKIACNDAVLVQGPPGTGKTHTIANLIGNFMAAGKNVLVTSYSSKALKVLKSQLAKSLQPLCVSLLDESKQQLEEAINNINRHLTNDNPQTLNKAASKLEEQRAALLKKLATAKKTLLEAIESEYHPITFAGKEYAPKEAAQFVGQERDALGWIPGKIAPLVPLPLGFEELNDLYSSNSAISIEDEKLLSEELPAFSDLIKPNEIKDAIAIINDEDYDDGREYWVDSKGIGASDELHLAIQTINDSIEQFTPLQEWKLSAAYAGTNKAYLEPWNNLISGIDELIELGAKVSNILLTTEIELDDTLINDATIQCMEQILEKNTGKRTISKRVLIFKPEWKRLINACKVNGKAPTERVDFENLFLYCEYKKKQETLSNRFKKLITAFGGPDLSGSEKIEIIVKEWQSVIEYYINWYEKTAQRIIIYLKKSGFRWEDFIRKVPAILSQYGETEKLIHILHDILPQKIEAELSRRKVRHTKEKLKQYKQRLKPFFSNTLIKDLINAVNNYDYDKYNEAYQSIKRLIDLAPIYKRRTKLLEILKEKAPDWAYAIKKREGIHGQPSVPKQPKEAWLWCQLNQELDRRLSVDIGKVQKDIEELSSKLLEVTEDLICKKAWYSELSAVSNVEKRMALSGWADMIKQMGSRKGKRARILINQAKAQMKLCQDSVPVWIMPLNRVIENFSPGETVFDVVIIDEASQVDALGLVALYLGKKVIVVGDNKQVTPVSVGVDINIIEQLQHEFLKGIPNAALYNELLSVYDMASWTYEPIRLREHFRCATPIIQFSNRYYYDDIKPMRDCSLVKRKPHTIAYKVEGETEGTKRNFVEAKTIVALIKSCMEHEEYSDATFGVISVLGEEQAVLIDEMLRLSIDEKKYIKHHILCGNPSHFQGDERDVIFISVVDSPRDSGGPLSLRTDGYNEMYAKRYNVAASRAKDQLWVVYSLNPDTDLKPGDIRANLILHAINPEGKESTLSEHINKAESEFEKMVIKALTLKGYNLIPQYPVGSFRLDIVVEYRGKQVAIECDGDKYHGMEKLIEDLARQSILERLGWRFIRIRGSEFFRNQEKTINSVIEELNELGILPDTKESLELNKENCLLKDSIIRRAVEIMESEEIPNPKSVRGSSIWGKYHEKPNKDNGQKISEIIEIEKVINKQEVKKATSHRRGRPPKKPEIKQDYEQISFIPVKKGGADKKISFSVKKRTFDVISYLEQKGFEVIDNREMSRIIWVIGDLTNETEFLKEKGYTFQYYPRGAIATSGRAAWRCNI
jgi:very-short-patch-repair endonuclease